MEKKRVLITYATYGSGHKTVANYVYEYLNKYSNYEIKIIDLMDYENIIGYVSKKAFEQNFKHKTSSLIFSLIYEIMDSKATTMPYKQITKSVFKNKRLKEDIIAFNPDLLISTHFFGNIVVGMLNKKRLINAKIISIIPDYVSHEMWLKDEKSINAFIVSNDIVKRQLVDERINPKKVYAYGLPLSEKFKNLGDVTELKIKYNVNNKKKTFLFFAGGSLGSSFSYDYLKKLLHKRFDINIIFVCGKNDKLRTKVLNLIDKNDYQNVLVLGFSNEVNNLLNIADVVISKPGGLSITESLEMKKPMLLISGNGGQEIYNARFICKNGYGLNCRTPRKLVRAVNNLLYKKNLLNSIKNKLNTYHDNDSVEKIYILSEKLLDEKTKN